MQNDIYKPTTTAEAEAAWQRIYSELMEKISPANEVPVGGQYPLPFNQ